jgi:hypothetical protein
MKIDNKFLIFRTLAGYERAKDMIKESSIVFVIENRSIYTHGVRFGGESVDLSDYVTDDDLSDYIKKDEIDQYIPQQPSAGDNKKHIFLTQDEYDDLDGEYEENAIYFILQDGQGGETPTEQEDEYGTSFGDRFPFKFGWSFDESFPVVLN